MISILLPVYNEGKNLSENIAEVYEFMRKEFKNFELVIVDDSSKDNSPEILKKLVKKYKKLSYVRFENGPSRRENLGLAMKKAKFPLVGFMDFDLSTPLIYLPELVKSIESGSDIAIGSRRLKNSKVNRSFYRLAWSNLYHDTVKFLFKSKINDYQCGFKLFKKDVLNNLLDKSGYDKKFIRGWFWDAELLIRAEKLGYKIKEIPVNWDAGENTTFNVFREIKVLPYMLKLRFFKH